MEVITVEEYRNMLRQPGGKRAAGSQSQPNYNALFLLQLQATDIPLDVVEQEYRFHPTRKWRFDFAIPSLKIAIELDGGEAMRTVTCANCGANPARMTTKKGSTVIRLGGGHHTPDGYRRNREKMNEAVLLGWAVLGASGKQVEDGDAVEWFARLWRQKCKY